MAAETLVSRKRGCRPAEKADDIEQATKAAVQAALCYALTTPDPSWPTVHDYAVQGEANLAMSQPRMLDTKVIDKYLATDPTIKKLKQLVKGGASKDARDWPRGLTEYFVKHAYYTVIGNTLLINGKVIIPGGLRSQMLSALHRSHRGVGSMNARARVARFWPTMNTDIQQA